MKKLLLLLLLLPLLSSCEKKVDAAMVSRIEQLEKNQSSIGESLAQNKLSLQDVATKKDVLDSTERVLGALNAKNSTPAVAKVKSHKKSHKKHHRHKRSRRVCQSGSTSVKSAKK